MPGRKLRGQGFVGRTDLVVAAVFGVNAIGCAAVVMLTTYKRYQHRPLVRKNIYAELLRESDCRSVRESA